MLPGSKSGKIYSPIFATEGESLVAIAGRELGSRYGLGRPLFKCELARLIGLKPGPGNMVTKMEAGRASMSGPVEVVIRMLLDGHLSP